MATGIWGLWMVGFMLFIAGTYLFLGLTLFGRRWPSTRTPEQSASDGWCSRLGPEGE
jgi:hypothetical protein